MEYPEPLQIRDVVTINVSSLTVKRGTYIQLRIPKPDCSVDNPSFHVLEIAVSDEKVVTIHATPGTPEIQIWEDD